jgi:hypothetical protein
MPAPLQRPASDSSGVLGTALRLHLRQGRGLRSTNRTARQPSKFAACGLDFETMSKRPNVFDLDSVIVKKPAAPDPAPAPVPAVEPKPVAAAPAASKTFRTSTYFHRAVHDVLRAIAFEERKNVADLINEGLDAVLTRRNYPTTAEIIRRT